MNRMSTEFGRLLAEVMHSMQSGTPKEQLIATMNIYGYHMKLKSRITELEKAYIEADDEVDNLLLEREVETGKLRASIAELEAEIEDLKPYKYGYSTRKKPEFYTRVLVDYNGSLDFGDFDDDGNWETCARDNIREGVKRWYPLPILPEDTSDEPA